MKFFAALIFAISMGACKPALSAQDAADLANTQAQIEDCKSKGRAANSYKVYDECMKGKGLH